MVRQKHQELRALLEPVVNVLGCELVGIEYLPQGKRSLLRVYIDKEGGVTIDDCGDVSHQISAVMDVEDPIREQYTLEVSSPGLDRPLFTIEHFARYIGSRVKLRLYAAVNERRNFSGTITATEQNNVIVDVDGEQMVFDLESIEKARLVPEF